MVCGSVVRGLVAGGPVQPATCYALCRVMLRVRHQKDPMFMQVVSVLRVQTPKGGGATQTRRAIYSNLHLSTLIYT